MNRSFICASVFALILVVPALAADDYDHSGAQKLGWKLALQSWTVHKTAADAMEVAQKIGVRYMAFYPGNTLAPGEKGGFGPGMTDEQVRKTLDFAKRCDVHILTFGSINIPNSEDGARKIFEWAKKMGINPLLSEPADPKAMPLIDRLAGEYGIKVAIHNHPKPARYWDPAYVYSLVKDLEHVGFCADTGHWKRSGLDPVEVLRKYGHKVVSLDFKDLTGKGMHDVPWGTGDCRAAEMLAVLKEKGFQGPFCIEYEYTWDLPTLRKCAEFFHGEANRLTGK